MATKITSGSIFSAGAVVTGVDADAPPAVPSPSPEPAPAPATSQILPLSRAVSLLMDASATADGSVVDSSSNSHPITVNGDVSQSSFSPYRSGGYSWEFDGNGDFISAPLSDSLQLGSEDYTVESWFYMDGDIDFGGNAIVSKGTSGQHTIPFYTLEFDTSNVLKWFVQEHSSSAPVVSSSPLTPYQWYHVAVTRSGSTHVMYINGVAVSTNNVSYTMGSGGDTFRVGCGWYATNREFKGSISDLRIVKGTAVYTADFTSPTERLTEVAGTSLLTCNLPYLQSGLTAHGDVSPVAAGPYDYAGYSESLHGGSYVFDGSGDSLTIASDSSLYLDGDFTIEFWINNETIAIDTQHPSPVTFAGNLGQIYTNSSNNFYGLYYDTGDIVTTGNNTAKTGVWQHVAFTRSGSTCYAFVDGVLKNTATSSQAFSSSTGTFRIGSYNGTGGDVNGNMSDIRIVKGTAVYTADFTPSTAPLEAVTGTSLLLSGNNASIRDESQSVESISVFGNTTVADSSPYGTGKSIAFDGDGDYIRFDEALDSFTSTTESFTIEFWMRPERFNDGSAVDIPFAINSISTGSNELILVGNNNGAPSGQGQYVTLSGSGANPSYSLGLNLQDNGPWYHIAMTYDGTTFKLYVDGTVAISQNVAFTIPFADCSLLIGADADSANAGSLGNYYKGRLADLRIVKGTAVYTENFTVPSAPLGDYTETVASPEPAPEPAPEPISSNDFTITGLSDNTLYTSENGLSLLAAGGSWSTYRNLPTYLTGLLTTRSVNDGNDHSWTIPTCKVYMIRQPDWEPVDLTGWTLIESGTDYINYPHDSRYTNLDVYSKDFIAGTYTFDNFSAMYMFADPE